MNIEELVNKCLHDKQEGTLNYEYNPSWKPWVTLLKSGLENKHIRPRNGFVSLGWGTPFLEKQLEFNLMTIADKMIRNDKIEFMKYLIDKGCIYAVLFYWKFIINDKEYTPKYNHKPQIKEQEITEPEPKYSYNENDIISFSALKERLTFRNKNKNENTM